MYAFCCVACSLPVELHAGNAQFAVLTGMFASDNYNWRSMTSPGITGLFNKNCLESGAANLMKCYPGDNTYERVQTSVSLVNLKNPYHGLFTTVATNGATPKESPWLVLA